MKKLYIFGGVGVLAIAGVLAFTHTHHKQAAEVQVTAPAKQVITTPEGATMDVTEQSQVQPAPVQTTAPSTTTNTTPTDTTPAPTQQPTPGTQTITPQAPENSAPTTITFGN